MRLLEKYMFLFILLQNETNRLELNKKIGRKQYRLGRMTTSLTKTFSGYLASLEVDCRIAGFSFKTPRALLRGETSSMHIFLTFPRVPFGRKMDSKLLLRWRGKMKYMPMPHFVLFSRKYCFALGTALCGMAKLKNSHKIQ